MAVAQISLCVAGFGLVSAQSAVSQELAVSEPGSGLGALATHDHAPILVRSRPVIERLAVSVVEPVDLCVSSRGNIYIADRRAQVVFRLTPAGHTELAATEIDGLLRILVDADESLYILSGSAGSGRVLQVTESGFTTEVFSVDFAPCGFDRDQTGVFVVSAASGRSVQIHTDGARTELAVTSEPIVDVVLNSAEQTMVLLKSGRVLYLGSDGSSAGRGFAPAGSSRLFSLPEGQLAVLSQQSDQRPFVQGVVREADQMEFSAPYAQVPSGTVAVAFDPLGNLCLANPDLHAVTRVTSRFRIPCPHCGQSLRMIFSTDPADFPEEPFRTKSF